MSTSIYPHGTGFAHAQAAAVHDFGDHPQGRRDLVKQCSDFPATQNRWQASCRFCPNRVEGPEVGLQHLLVEEDEGIQVLVLCGRCHATIHREVCKERLHVGRTQLRRMPPSAGPTVEAKERHSPRPVGALGAA